MNQPKHTPGPWSYSPPFDDGSMLRSSWQPAIISRYEPAGDGSKYRRLVEICAFEFRMTPSEADGRLMAAAPELLEALKRCLQIMENGGTWTLEDQNAAHAAIAKAEGAQP